MIEESVPYEALKRRQHAIRTTTAPRARRTGLPTGRDRPGGRVVGPGPRKVDGTGAPAGLATPSSPPGRKKLGGRVPAVIRVLPGGVDLLRELPPRRKRGLPRWDIWGWPGTVEAGVRTEMPPVRGEPVYGPRAKEECRRIMKLARENGVGIGRWRKRYFGEVLRGETPRREGGGRPAVEWVEGVGGGGGGGGWGAGEGGVGGGGGGGGGGGVGGGGGAGGGGGGARGREGADEEFQSRRQRARAERDAGVPRTFGEAGGVGVG